MIDLREKYAKLLAEVKADAEANMEETRKAVADQEKALVDAKASVNVLLNKMKDAQSDFCAVGRELLVAGTFKKSEIRDMSYPKHILKIYEEARQQLPEAEEEERDMQEKYEEALNALKLAEYELACVERFF